MGDIDDVMAFRDGLIQAFNRKDLAAFLASATDDFQAFVGIQTPFLLDGKSAWNAFINGLAQVPVVVYTQRQPSCRIVNGNSAVVNAYFDFTTVDKDGKATTVNGRETSVDVNATGKWVWANSHYSRIFEGP